MTMTTDTPPMLWLDDEPRARRTDDLTSHVAADSNRNRRWVEDTVLGLFARLGPMTDSEVTTEYFKNPGAPAAHVDSVRKRRSDLTKKGLLQPTNVTRPSPTGRKSRVFALSIEAVTR